MPAQIVRLGDIVEFAYGAGLPKAKRRAGSIPVYGSNGITGHHDEALVDCPTVIVGRKGSAGAISLTDGPSYPIDTTYYTKPRVANSVDVKYLFYVLERANLGKLATATGVPGLNREDAYRTEVPFHPIEEQRRIVDILDRAAGIRRLRRQAQDTARLIIPALFNTMFGDPATRASKWPIAALGDMLAAIDYPIRTGPFGSQLLHSEFVEEGIPVLGIDNVVTNHFRWTVSRCITPDKFVGFRRFKINPHDLIITIMGTTGRCAVAPDQIPECMSTKHLCVLSLDQATIAPKYAWAALLYDPFVRAQTERTGHGAIMEGWNMGLVRRLRLRIPPLRLQQQFVETCRDIELLMERQRKAAEQERGTQVALASRLLS